MQYCNRCHLLLGFANSNPIFVPTRVRLPIIFHIVSGGISKRRAVGEPHSHACCVLVCCFHFQDQLNREWYHFNIKVLYFELRPTIFLSSLPVNLSLQNQLGFSRTACAGRFFSTESSLFVPSGPFRRLRRTKKANNRPHEIAEKGGDWEDSHSEDTSYLHQ